MAEYQPKDINKCLVDNISIGCNNAGLDFPVDIIAAMDYAWIMAHKKELESIGKPVLTREWDILKPLDIDFIFLPNRVGVDYRLTGQMAIKAFSHVAKLREKSLFILGIDHTNIHYDGTLANITDIVDGDYAWMKCDNVINLGKGSNITCWPKVMGLPCGDGISKEDIPSILDSIRINAEDIFWGK